MKRQNKFQNLIPVVALLTVSVSSAFAAPTPAPRSESSIEAAPASGYLLGDWEITPSFGGAAVKSEVAFNVGTTFSYQVIEGERLYLEPKFDVSFLPGVAYMNFGAGARYDIAIPGTDFKPFGKFSVGPTLRTKGDVLAINAFAGFGVLYPAARNMDFRAEAGMINYDGSAGFLASAGLGF